MLKQVYKHFSETSKNNNSHKLEIGSKKLMTKQSCGEIHKIIYFIKIRITSPCLNMSNVALHTYLVDIYP